MSQQYKKPSRYVTFGAGKVKLDDEGMIKVISLSIDPKFNSKNNDGQGYVVYAIPVDGAGEPQFNDAVPVNSFAVAPTGADKQKYPNAPDFRAFFGVE